MLNLQGPLLSQLCFCFFSPGVLGVLWKCCSIFFLGKEWLGRNVCRGVKFEEEVKRSAGVLTGPKLSVKAGEHDTWDSAGGWANKAAVATPPAFPQLTWTDPKPFFFFFLVTQGRLWANTSKTPSTIWLFVFDNHVRTASAFLCS